MSSKIIACMYDILAVNGNIASLETDDDNSHAGIAVGKRKVQVSSLAKLQD